MRYCGWLSSGLIVLASLVCACRAQPPAPATPSPGAVAAEPPDPSRTPLPAVTSTTTASPPSRVILISVDAGRGDWLREWMDGGEMPTLAALRNRGLMVGLEGVNPPTSAVAHASLATGGLPAHTGIVGERMHRPEDGLYWYTSAYDLPVEGESLWSAAREAGLTTAVLFWPGVTPSFPDTLPDYTVSYGEREAYSKQHRLTFYAAPEWAGGPPSYSPPQESQFQIEDQDDSILATIYVLAQDTTDDSAVNYDLFILSSDRAVGEQDAVLRVSGGWSNWVIDPVAGRGADFLITEPDLGSFTLYQGNVYRLIAAPEDFQQAVIERFGFFAPPPDYYALEHGWITEDQYITMLRRQSDWMMAVTGWVYETYQPDLLLTVQGPLDQAGHQFALVDERQAGYSSERAAAYADFRTQAAAQLDQALSDLISVVGPDIDSGGLALFVVGTTSMAPIHTQVNINTLLEQAGLLRLGSRGFVIVEQSQAIAFTSGGAVHVYINLAGRESAGIVSTDSYGMVQDQIVQLLHDLTDPATGERVFAQVLTHDELVPMGLDPSLAGDVFAQANLGYSLSDDRGPDAIFGPVTFYGQQGYAAELDVMQGCLVAITPTIRPGSEFDSVRLVDVAPTLAELMGFQLDSTDGQVIQALMAP